MRAAIDAAGVEAAQVDDIFWGCAMPEASQGLNVARLSSLRAGIPVEVPSATINRFCSSGLQTVALAAQEIICGNAEVARSEEHTSELQSQSNLVCRLLLEKKKK